MLPAWCPRGCCDIGWRYLFLVGLSPLVLVF